MNPLYKVENLKKIDVDKLISFSKEIRNDMIEIVSKTGGHIGVNMGISDITLCLHYVFDFPNDDLIFDVGHNVYTHKMLTDRLKGLKTMRQHNGMSGFHNPSESKYDLVNGSHAGTSLSTGLGVAISKRYSNDETITISVIGDASIVEGSSAEALNHIATEKVRMLIVINDNNIAIDDWNGGIKEMLSSNPKNYFESMGFDYYGPQNGHNIKGMVDLFQNLKSIDRPTILHLKTIKGYGLPWPDDNAWKYHWSFPYNKEDGSITSGNDYWNQPKGKFINSVASQAIREILKKDKNAMIISPATNGISGLVDIFNDFPDQTVDVAMAEQHAVAFACALPLKSNIKPILCFQSAFLPRAYDQLIQELCLNNSPVLILDTRSGLGGLDHEVHHSLMDISYLSPLPNLKIKFPSGVTSLKNTIIDSYENLDGPTIILYAYGTIPDLVSNDEEIKLNNKLNKLKDCNLALLTIGNTEKLGYELQRYLWEEKHIASLVENIVDISPLNEESLMNVCNNYKYLISLEENMLRGGFGSAIAEFVCDNSLNNKLHRVGFQNEFVAKGLRSFIYPKYGLDIDSIVKAINDKWDLKGLSCK